MNLDDLYQYYFYDIYRFLLSLSNDHNVAEDLLQEKVFLSYLYLENYNDEHVKTWLFIVARNVFIDHYRKQKRTIIKDQPFFKQYHDKDKLPLEQIMLNENVRDIKKWLEH